MPAVGQTMLHRTILCPAFLFVLLSSLVAQGVPAPANAPAPTTQASLQTADDAYRATFYWLSKGKQSEAEQVLAEAIELYECHEGNHAITNILSASRAAEKANPAPTK